MLTLLNNQEAENKVIVIIIQLSTDSILAEWAADSVVSSRICSEVEQEVASIDGQVTENQLQETEKLNSV